MQAPDQDFAPVDQEQDFLVHKESLDQDSRLHLWKTLIKSAH